MPDILSVLCRFEKSVLKGEYSTVVSLILNYPNLNKKGLLETKPKSINVIIYLLVGCLDSFQVSQIINNVMSTSCMWFAYRLSRNPLR